MVSENGAEYKKFVRLCKNFTERFVSSRPGSLRLRCVRRVNGVLCKENKTRQNPTTYFYVPVTILFRKISL